MTIPSQTEIVLTITPTALPRPEVWAGQGMRVALQIRDIATLAPVLASGVLVLVLRPGDAVPTSYAQSELTADGDGRWVLDVATDTAGAWRVRAECAAPRPAAAEARFDVRGSGVLQPQPPAVILATPEGEAITTPDGAAITARRADRLADLGDAEAGDKLVVVRDDVAGTMQWSGLAAGAAAAGEEAALVAVGAAYSPVAISTPTALNAGTHAARLLVLTGAGNQISAAWSSTGAGFACTLLNRTGYWAKPGLVGFTQALLTGVSYGIRPGGIANFLCIQDGDDRVAYLVGNVE